MDSTQVYDLDALENEADKTPFVFRLKGEEYTLASPEEADWRMEITDAASMEALIEELLGDEQYERFSANKLPSWKFGKLLDQAAEHYGIGSGESPASTPSPRNTRKR